MKIPDVYFTGNNICQQTKLAAEVVNEFTALNIADICKVDEKLEIQKFSILITIHYALIALDNKLYVRSSLLENDLKVLEFTSLIFKVSASDTNCLILLESGIIHKYDFIKKTLNSVDFLDVETSDENEPHEKIEDVSCSLVSYSCYSTNKSLYSIPSKIYQFEKHQNIKKIVSGNEHSLILLKNGEVYSWGCGLRGQLGFGDIEIEESPKLIESLAGIKIMDISAGSFCSLCVSSFGDIYGWGWNNNGELGIETGKSNVSSKEISTKQSVYVDPQIIEIGCDEDDIIKVSSGANHTIVQTKSGKYFCSGSNEFGQLGLNQESNLYKWSKVKSNIFIDSFTELKFEHLKVSSEILCNHLSTIIINKKF